MLGSLGFGDCSRRGLLGTGLGGWFGLQPPQHVALPLGCTLRGDLWAARASLSTSRGCGIPGLGWRNWGPQGCWVRQLLRRALGRDRSPAVQGPGFCLHGAWSSSPSLPGWQRMSCSRACGTSGSLSLDHRGRSRSRNSCMARGLGQRTKVGSPAGDKCVIPPTGLACCRRYNPHRPTGVMNFRKPRGQGHLHLLRDQPQT